MPKVTFEFNITRLERIPRTANSYSLKLTCFVFRNFAKTPYVAR